MKKIYILFLYIFISASVYSQAADSWMQKSNLPNELEGSVGFTIGNYGYVSTGDTEFNYVGSNVLFRYNPDSDSWARMADMNGANTRMWTIGFSIGRYGYVGLGGTNISNTCFNDLQRYDTASNSWSLMANFPGTPRHSATSFVINDKAYVTAGFNATATPSLMNDLWEYNPSTNMWAQKADAPFAARTGAMSFSINGKGYVGGGAGSSPACLNDYWKYDPSSDSWTQIDSFPGNARAYGLGFSIGNYGYVATGMNNNSAYFNDLWRYDPQLNSWQQKANFPGVARDEAAAFVINNKGYLAAGVDVNWDIYNDMWEYTSDNFTNVEDIHSSFDFTIYPNPSASTFTISLNKESAIGNWDLGIFDVTGRVVHEQTIHSQLSTVNCQLTAGVYFVKVSDGERVMTQKLIIE